MNPYKYYNQEETLVRQQPNTIFDNRSPLWEGFQEYIDDGGIVDPWKTRDELEADTLSRLTSCYIQKKLAGGFEYDGKGVKLIKSLRKESKGNAKAEDIKVLDDNDIVDGWYDQLEVDMEVWESWVEDPARTDQELIDFDPCVDVTWTFPPVLP